MSWKLDAEGFHLDEPLRYRPWYNFLSNGEYGLKLSHLGDGYASTLTEPRVVVTNYDFFTPNRGRFLYVREESGEGSAEIWNPGFYPSANAIDSYSCTHAPGYSVIGGAKNGIELSSLHILPETGTYEIWRVKARNLSDRPRTFSVFSLAEFLLYDNMAIDPVYFSWFTGSRYLADLHQIEFFRTDAKPVHGFIRSTRKPTAWESSLTEWKLDGDYRDPQSVRRGFLGNNPSGGDPYVGAYQFDLELDPGQTDEWVLIIGQGEQASAESARLYPGPSEVGALQERTIEHWRRRLNRPEWSRIADAGLAAYARTFFPYQIIQQSTGMVRSTFRGFRDVAQDAMGLSFFDAGAAGDLIRTLCTKMTPQGRCLRQWNTGGGYNDERDFRDLPMWLPLAVDRYLEAGGSPAILDEQVGFFAPPASDAGGAHADAGPAGSVEPESVWEHMIRGMEYVLQYGPHGLIRMGVGDWNDALSGLGTEGESLWLNQMAFYALGILRKLARRYDRDCRLDLDGHRDRLYNGVMRGWTGEWFLRGYHEDGTAVGAAERIFLLPQAWFTISGMAERAPDKARTALESMVARLRNDHGLLICHPGFDGYDPAVGNLSCLAPGVAENFAVYNHASAFGVYALFKAGMVDEGREFLGKLLPFRKDEKRTKAEPFVLVNYYNGGFHEAKAGQGGVPWLTGTVHWLALSLFDLVFPSDIEL
jgi:cellobiose phosphorylase